MFLELDKSCCSGLLFDPVVIVCSVSFGFTPREEDAKFRDFSRYFEVVLLEQVVVQKTSEIPIILSVSGGNPESRRGTVL